MQNLKILGAINLLGKQTDNHLTFLRFLEVTFSYIDH